MEIVKLKITVPKWRVWLCRIWIWAIITSKWILPMRLGEEEAIQEKMLRFITRGVKLDKV